MGELRGVDMTVDVFDVALDGAMAALDTSERVWLVGVARMADVPETRDFTDAEVEGVLDTCERLTEFPASPVNYSSGGYTREAADEYRLISLVAPSAPHLVLKLGLGIAGFVAVAFTRTGDLDGGVVAPSGVLLTDMEAVIADTYSLVLAAAVRLGYQGAIDLVFAVSGDGPGRTPIIYTIGEEDGALLCQARLDEPVEPLRHRFEMSGMTTESVHRDLYGVALEFARRYGVYEAQLVQPSGLVEPYYASDPLGAARREAAAAE